MKIDNWIVAALLFVACCAFLGLWYYLGFNAVDSPTDLIFTLVWWVIIAAMAVVIHKAEKKRQEHIRAAYVAQSLFFNPEVGMVSVAAGTSVVNVLAHVLGGLKYPFKIQEFPEQGSVAFNYIVETKKFDNNGDVWEGVVRTVAQPEAEPIPFASREELITVLR